LRFGASPLRPRQGGPIPAKTNATTRDSCEVVAKSEPRPGFLKGN
jgi:hypothetical protein